MLSLQVNNKVLLVSQTHNWERHPVKAISNQNRTPKSQRQQISIRYQRNMIEPLQVSWSPQPSPKQIYSMTWPRIFKVKPPQNTLNHHINLLRHMRLTSQTHVTASWQRQIPAVPDCCVPGCFFFAHKLKVQGLKSRGLYENQREVNFKGGDFKGWKI